MTLRESQQNFVDLMNLFDTWPDKFTLLIEKSAMQDRELSDELLPFRILNCQSRTYFRVQNIDGTIHITGWSNSSVMSGLIQAIAEIFNYYTINDVANEIIDFHIKSGLINNVTPMRSAAIMEMINRINVLCKG